MLFDYLLLDDAPPFPKKGVILSLIPGIYYLIFILIRAEISDVKLTYGSRYPYWFVDIDAFRLVRKSKWNRSYLLGIVDDFLYIRDRKGFILDKISKKNLNG